MNKSLFVIVALTFCFSASGKTFKNSYVSFEVPDTWICLQEGVAWTCTPRGPYESKEAVIVLAAKVAGADDTLSSFMVRLKQPKKITTKVGTLMPSTVMYSRKEMLAGTEWVRAQHLGSEIQEYFTLYLATVKERLAILVSFSAEKGVYKKYNPVFEKAMQTLKIVASQKLLFPKGQYNPQTGLLGIQPNQGTLGAADMAPLPQGQKKSGSKYLILILVGLIAAIVVAYLIMQNRGSKKPAPKIKKK